MQDTIRASSFSLFENEEFYCCSSDQAGTYLKPTVVAPHLKKGFVAVPVYRFFLRRPI